MNSKHYPWPIEYQLDGQGKYCGRRPAHWQREARHLVADAIYRAAVPLLGELASPCQSMAGVRLLELLQAEDPEMLQLVIDDRERCMAGMAAMLTNIYNSKNPIIQNMVGSLNLQRGV